MARITVFGAGTMGTALAIHLARKGNATVLWASPFDAALLPVLREERRHPALPGFLPESLSVVGSAELARAADGVEVAVMGAHSGGARTLARIVREGSGALPLVVGVAKGLEPESGLRMSEVYSEEVGHNRVVSVGGPCLAPEVAQGLPTAAVFASVNTEAAEEGALAFRTAQFHVEVTDDVVGVEYASVIKNVAAMGMGMLDGLAKVSPGNYRNAKAALFTQAVRELAALVISLGGRPETALGLAGLGDTLVTSLGGRNRLFGEMVGEGADPRVALDDLVSKGMTVEGVDSAREVRRLAEGQGLDLPLHLQVHRILFDSSGPATLLDCLKG